MATASAKPLTGMEKAAILLVLLGEEATAAVYRNLSEEDLHRLTEQIAALQNVPPEAADQVLHEYQPADDHAGISGGRRAGSSGETTFQSVWRADRQNSTRTGDAGARNDFD